MDSNEPRLVDINSVPRLRSSQFRSLYANFAFVNSALHDFSVILCDLTRDVRGKPSLEELERLILSPSFAKALSITLALNVQKYEKQWGEIRLPDDEGPAPVPSPSSTSKS
jgi:hypothetical protein